MPSSPRNIMNHITSGCILPAIGEVISPSAPLDITNTIAGECTSLPIWEVILPSPFQDITSHVKVEVYIPKYEEWYHPLPPWISQTVSQGVYTSYGRRRNITLYSRGWYEPCHRGVCAPRYMGSHIILSPSEHCQPCHSGGSAPRRAESSTTLSRSECCEPHYRGVDSLAMWGVISLSLPRDITNHITVCPLRHGE